MKDDVDEMNNTCVVLLGNVIDVIMWCEFERDGKIRECEDDDVWWNEISVSIIMFVCLCQE